MGNVLYYNTPYSIMSINLATMEEKEVYTLNESELSQGNIYGFFIDIDGILHYTINKSPNNEEDDQGLKNTLTIHTHIYDNWITIKNATCTTDGKQYRKCSFCGKAETQIIKATGHKYITTIVEPTCTQSGIKEIVCSECGEKETEEIPATGHTFGEWKVTKEPTTTETGLKERVCSVCGEKETEVIPKLEDTKPTEPTKPTNPTTTTINAPKMVNTTSTNNSVKVRWNSAKDVDGYIITTYCDGKKVKSADVKNATVTTVNGLRISKNYLFGVKSYKMIDGKKVYGKEVGLKASTLPSAPKLTVKAGKKSAKLSWKKVPNATKYEVYMKVGKSYKKVAAVKGTSFTKKGLKSGGKYSFKIKTIKVANFKADAKYGMNKRTKIYTSKPSAIKTVKVK